MSEVVKMGLKELEYKELLLLASNGGFYKTVVTREDVVEYLNAIHVRYCNINKIKPVKIEISSDLADNTYGAYNYNDHKIYINSKFLEMFYDCKDEEILIQTMIDLLLNRYGSNIITAVISGKDGNCCVGVTASIQPFDQAGKL